MTLKSSANSIARPSPNVTRLKRFSASAGWEADKRLSKSGLADRIGREIIAGEYQPGTLFPTERHMLERFGVSRTALREAYSKLTAKGLVQARPRVGTSILPRSEWNMLDQDVLEWHLQTMKAEDLAQDLYQIRRMIEPSAAEIAAISRTDEDMVQIDAAFAAMQSNAGDHEPLIEADYSFHVAILRATQNGFMGAFSSLIRAAMLSTFELSWRGAEVIKDVRLQQHADVANAIRKRKPTVARRAMQALLDQSIEDVRGAMNALNDDTSRSPKTGN